MMADNIAAERVRAWRASAKNFAWPNNFVAEKLEPVTIPIMTTLEHTPTNQTKLTQAQTAWQDLVRQTLRRGFYGSAIIELAVQDGTIQHVRHSIERLEK
jgi:hypothetical protein